MLKLMGAALVILGCGGCGFAMAAARRREERDLRLLLRAMEYMDCELQFRGSPLPELCAHAGQAVGGAVGAVFSALAGQLDRQSSPEVSQCVDSALLTSPGLANRVTEAFHLLGTTLGRFDLAGQTQGLAAVSEVCRDGIQELSEGRESRLRGYQTLGLCAGAALAILFL